MVDFRQGYGLLILVLDVDVAKGYLVTGEWLSAIVLRIEYWHIPVIGNIDWNIANAAFIVIFAFRIRQMCAYLCILEADTNVLVILRSNQDLAVLRNLKNIIYFLARKKEERLHFNRPRQLILFLERKSRFWKHFSNGSFVEFYLQTRQP